MVKTCRTLLFLFLCHAVTPEGHAGEVRAAVPTKPVPAGEAAELSLEIKGSQVEMPQFPSVPGVRFIGPTRQFSSFSSINGVASRSYSLSYGVRADSPGEYNIPPIVVKVDGEEIRTPAFKLKVVPSANQAPETLKGTGKTPDAILRGSDKAQLSVELALAGGREYVWVGEIAPVCIQAWLPEGMNLQVTSGLTPEGTAFTLHNISEKRNERHEVVNNRRWFVVTWYAGLSAAKAGNYLPDIAVKGVQHSPDPNSRPDFFGRRAMMRENVVLTSREGAGTPIEVRELPRQGRPKNFGGAVGKFSLQSANLPAEWKTGEPQQLIAVVAGSGNFGLLTQPAVLPEDNWKSYEGNPEFQPLDSAAFSGTQKWTFNASPRKPGDQPISIAFDYFDPEAGRYQNVTSVVQQVKVTGEASAVEETPAAPGRKEPEQLPGPPREGDSALRSLVPLAYRPAFPVVLGLSGAAALTGILAGVLRKRGRNEARRLRAEAERAVSVALHEADSLAARGDVPGFFAAARRVLQARLAALWARPAQAITLADVAARVPADSPVVEIFREADRVEFGHDRDVELIPWKSRLHSAVKSLTA